MSNYLALKQTGTLDSASAQKLVDQSISYIEQSSGQTTQITQSQLNIVTDNGKQSITDYGENLGTIAKSKSIAEINEEGNLIIQVLQSADATQLNKLGGVIVGYENILAKLVKMPVPKQFTKAHLDIVNGTNGIVSALKAIKDAPNDPLKGLAAVQAYQNRAILLSQAVNATVMFIKQNNIIYKQGSGGYYLLYGI